MTELKNPRPDFASISGPEARELLARQLLAGRPHGIRSACTC